MRTNAILPSLMQHGQVRSAKKLSQWAPDVEVNYEMLWKNDTKLLLIQQFDYVRFGYRIVKEKKNAQSRTGRQGRHRLI
jgi:hypothetical protein